MKLVIAVFRDEEMELLSATLQNLTDLNKNYEIIELEDNSNGEAFIGEQQKIFQNNNFKLFVNDRQVYHKDRRICLTEREFLILYYLMKRPEKIYTKEELYHLLYSDESAHDIRNTIYCLIRSLRKKIEANPANPKHIITVKGVGYKFNKHE